MVTKLLAAALCCLLLIGCGSAQPAPIPRLVPDTEKQNDTLQCFPLEAAECRFFVFGDDLLLLTPREAGTEIARYGGKLWQQKAICTLPGTITEVFTGENRIFCYDSGTKLLTVLDDSLVQQQCLRLPENAQGSPVLSEDGNSLLYCTDERLMMLTLDSGIHRTLRQMQRGDWQCIGAECSSCFCTYTDGSGTHCLQISTTDGSLQAQLPEVTALGKLGQRLILNMKYGSSDCLDLESALLPLLPEWHFLALSGRQQTALVYRGGDSPELGYYDLNTGRMTAKTVLNTRTAPIQAAITDNGNVFLLTADAILRQWVPGSSPYRELTGSLVPPQGDPALTRACSQWVQSIQERYSITLRLGEEAVAMLPEGIQAEAETLSTYWNAALGQIDRTFRRFPDGFVRKAVQGSEQTYLCIVRSIHRNGKSLESCQFWQNGSSFILLTAGENTADALLSAFSPMIDNRVFLHSGAYDNWEALNPAGFRYGAETSADITAFAASSGAHSPADDRAALFCAAMARGNRELFLSAVPQNKLRVMSHGIREAFGLTDYAGTLPWEQHLWGR